MLVVEVTCRDEAEGNTIGRTISRERLAACANVIPAVTSFFYWKGNFTGNRESVLLLKTSEAKYSKLVKRVKQIHSYKLPSIVAWKAKFDKPYEKWAKKELKAK